jgi:hypothetical protein
MVEIRSSLLMNNWLSIKKTMSPSVLIGQIKLNHQDCLLSIILGIGIGKGRGFNQQLASYSPFEPSMPVSYAPYATLLIVIHHGVGVIHGDILHISGHTMLSMQATITCKAALC